MMESMGFAVTEAENGRQALVLCASVMPDVILLDWNMPVLGGLDFLAELRGSKGGWKPKVVVCTTECDPDNLRRGFKAGADEYLIKPVDQQTLEFKLQQIGVI
jgi:two-component system chemotaxis response regulator CheY